MQQDCAEASYSTEALPPFASIAKARASLVDCVPEDGIGLAKLKQHIENEISPALDVRNQSPNYYGFVTGGSTPAATFGDHMAVDHDATVQVHLPKESIAVEVEDKALRMLCDLFGLPENQWNHRTFTTGATASNVMGLACGRDFVVQRAAAFRGVEDVSVANDGLLEATRKAGLTEVQILTTVPHSSLRKAAAIVGLGRARVKDLSLASQPHRFDMKALERALKQSATASIVVVSCAEVNTGFFATTEDDMRLLRRLCDQYGAWIHVDAAFGLLARVLPHAPQYEQILEGVGGLELCDSITGDAHKLLNVPYDCGIFLSRHLALGTSIFQNTNAAYLTISSSSTPSSIPVVPSPLNIGIENSRRFRALPVYCTVVAYGRQGYRDMMERQIKLARLIAEYIDKSEAYELLPKGNEIENIYIIILFRAKDPKLNEQLVQRIQDTRRIYVSGTQWNDEPAARFAVASWQVQPQREIETIKQVLEKVTKP